MFYILELLTTFLKELPNIFTTEVTGKPLLAGTPVLIYCTLKNTQTFAMQSKEKKKLRDGVEKERKINRKKKSRIFVLNEFLFDGWPPEESLT